MDVEEQRCMALEGIHTWARGVLEQVDQMERARASFGNQKAFSDARRSFECGRHMFLIAANRLSEYIKWAIELDFLDKASFVDFLALDKTIRFLRNKNEHAIEYFAGKVPEPKAWWHTSADGNADASSTTGTKIGGRLDWTEIAAICKKLIATLPRYYSPRGLDA